MNRHWFEARQCLRIIAALAISLKLLAYDAAQAKDTPPHRTRLRSAVTSILAYVCTTTRPAHDGGGSPFKRAGNDGDGRMYHWRAPLAPSRNEVESVD